MNMAFGSIYVGKEFAFQAALTGISHVVAEIGNEIFDSNDGALERDVERTINNLLAEHESELRVIFASRPELFNLLIKEALKITKDYQKTYNTKFAQNAKSVVPGAARMFGSIGSVAVMAGTTAVNTGLGLIKVNELADDFASKFGEALYRLSMHAHPDHLLTDQELLEKKEALSKILKDIVTSNAKGTFKSEVIGHLANFAAYFPATTLSSWFGKYLETRDAIKEAKSLAFSAKEQQTRTYPQIDSTGEFSTNGVPGKPWIDPDANATPLEKRALADKDLTVKWENGRYSFYDAANNPVHLESWFKMKDAPINEPIASKRVANDYEKLNQHFKNIEKGAYTPINQNKEISTLLNSVPINDRNLIEKLIKDIHAPTENMCAVSDLLGIQEPEISNIRKAAQAIGYAKNKYAEFAEKYPKLAQYGASAFNIAFQTIIAKFPGLSNALRGELVGFSINKAAGKEIAEGSEYVIDKGAKLFKHLYPDLTNQEAYDFSSGAVVMTTMLKDGSATAMQLLKHITQTKIHLPHHEGGMHKGHTVEMHVGWKDSELIDRFNNPQKYNPSQHAIKGASSFSNEEIAHRIVNEAKNAHAKQIADWLADPNSPKSLGLIYESNTVIGRGITKNTPVVHDMTKVRIFIKKDVNDFKKFNIITSHPVD